MVKKKAMCSLQTDVPGADIGMIKIRELHDFMHFTGLSGRHSVLERPLYEVNGRPFFSQKTPA